MLFDLSIIIVNYNVRFFLEYCLLSVRNASIGLNVQIIVLDNASTDADYGWIKDNFPEVTYIPNKENLGFGKANNIGIKLSKGEYVLFLNPDTIIPENALKDCLDFFRKKEDCGALGVHMMDGRGHFLPESKRSVPTPMVSFYKFSGLEKIFPTSKTFGKYALGYLDKDGVFAVPVLAGAFMMARKSLLSKVGGFDEAFFMYGEDIDLSFRLQNATGYKNYFLGNVKILHFKGESSKQDTLHYNKIFNEAMEVFVQKYYSKSQAFFMSLSIKLGTSISNIGFKLKRKLPMKKEAITESTFFLLGDPQTKSKLAENLSSQSSCIITRNKDEAQYFVYCVGDAYRYKDAFKELTITETHTPILWHDCRSNSLIGSIEKDEIGTVIQLEN